MEIIETNIPAASPAKVHTIAPAGEEQFQPKGAIAFFALLVIVGLIIWFGIYFLMLERI
jgi:hypothetical protein